MKYKASMRSDLDDWAQAVARSRAGRVIPSHQPLPPRRTTTHGVNNLDGVSRERRRKGEALDP
jgi:hypothetical protein